MSGAILVGFLTAYPINVWMVEKRLKHGMGTRRAIGKGGTPLESEGPRNAGERPKTSGPSRRRRQEPKATKREGA